MKRLLFPLALALALLPLSLVSQPVRTASTAENARIRAMSNLSFWMGTLVGEQNGSVVVGMLVQPVEGVDLRGGDVIRSVNGTAVASVRAMNRVFDVIPAGQPVRISVRRGGQSVAVSFAKPANAQRATVHVQPREARPPSRRSPR